MRPIASPLSTTRIFVRRHSNRFGSIAAMIAVVGKAMDENLRVRSHVVRKTLERLQGVDRVDAIGLPEPELQVRFDPAQLEELHLTPNQLADTVTAFFQDIAAGDVRLGQQNWLVRLIGADADPDGLVSRTVVGANGEVTLADVARVVRARYANSPRRC